MPNAGVAGDGRELDAQDNGGPVNGRLLAGPEFNKAMVRLQHIAAQKKALSDEEREVKRELKHSGVNPIALRMVLQFSRIDADERPDIFAELDAYATYLRFW